MPNDMAPQPSVMPPTPGEAPAGQPPLTTEQIMAGAAETARNIVDAALATPQGQAAEAAANIAAAAEAVGVPNTMPTAETAVTDVSTSQSQANSGAIRVIKAETPQPAVAAASETSAVASAWPAPEASEAPLVELPSPQVPKVNNEGLDAALNELYGDPATKTVEGAAVMPPKPAPGPTQTEVFNDQMAQHAAGMTWPEIQTPAADAAVNPMERMSVGNTAAVAEVTNAEPELTTTTTTPPETSVPTTTASDTVPAETVPTTTGLAPEVGVPTTTPPQESDTMEPSTTTTTTAPPSQSTVPTTISPSIPTVPPAGF